MIPPQFDPWERTSAYSKSPLLFTTLPRRIAPPSGFVTLISYCPQLSELELSPEHLQLHEPALSRLSKKALQLQAFDIDTAEAYRDLSYVNLAYNLVSLRAWGLMSIPTDASRLEASRAPPLHSDINWGTSVVPWVPIAITRARPWDLLPNSCRGTRDICCPGSTHYVSPTTRDFSSSSLAWRSSSFASSLRFYHWVCNGRSVVSMTSHLP